jgi:hypothetical protein
MHYTIYKVTNKINGKIYIGSHKTKNLDDGYMGSGKYLKRAIEKSGIENFEKEILFVYDNPEAMYQKEGELVNEDYLVTENTYNLKVGGFGGFDYINSNKLNAGMQYMKDNAKKLGKSGLKAVKEKYGDDWIKECAKKARIAARKKYPNGTFLGKKHSEETKRKISEKNSISLAGEKNSQYGTMWITDGSLNKKISKMDIIPDGWRKGRFLG